MGFREGEEERGAPGGYVWLATAHTPTRRHLMPASYLSPAPVDEFTKAREEFGALLAFVQSEAALGMEHGAIESQVRARGDELLRQVLQAHLARRLAGERREHALGADGIERRHHRTTSRQLVSVFGPVEVRREGVGTRGADGLYPADAELNLPADAYSHGLRRAVAVECSKASFEETVEAVPLVPKRQAENLARKASQDFDAFYVQRKVASALEPDDLVVLTTDGKGVVMRTEDLREATRKAATTGTRKLRSRLTKGEKPNRKRMATVASVYAVSPHPRSPEDIVSQTKSESTRLCRPKPKDKRVWASVAAEPESVIDEAFHEANRRDPRRTHAWVVLVDGALHQLDLILRTMARHHVTATLVIDLVHVTESLWRAAYCFHAEGTKAAESWVGERLLAILNGRSSHVAAGIRRAATLRGLAPDDRKAADTCANYLLKYRDYLHYDRYLAWGMPIATGVIEGACRHLVKDRMDVTGARWSLAGAEAVLRLRSLRASDDFDAYWQFHVARERERNHLRLYHHGRVPDRIAA